MIRASTALLALALSGCNQPNSDPSICGHHLTPRPSNPVHQSELSQAARSCVEEMSAKFGRGPDRIDLIADTVLSFCHEDIERATIGQIKSHYQIIPLEPEVRAYWHGQSMFVVAQVRAGNCYRDI